jgi:hypothetical protein
MLRKEKHLMKIKKLFTDKVYRSFIIVITLMVITLLFRIFGVLTPNWYVIINGVIAITYVAWTRITDV